MNKRLLPLILLLPACSSEEDDSGFSNTSDVADTANVEDTLGEDESTEESTSTDDTAESTSTDTTEETTTESTEETETETGEEDPCPLICDGLVDSTPNTCDAPYIIGRTKAKQGFFFGGSTNAATDDDNEACGSNDDPSNWDTSHDHFFRIWMYTGDTITVTQNPSGWEHRVKVHDEAECVGKAKICSDDGVETIEYTALKDDWFTIVADGRSIAQSDFGDYTLNVDLVEGEGVLDECFCL
ncbi:hypothetical protein G6O69_01735 [Pseudenhygromyxa sp. WMMC2535]|uniref:hypothetical protein n=1 Tax=Pseudenhygromyxa sp. WMMC2535 TaxID=2712867 RepID=UPI001555B576|nr:hypothetical protein [Pseudenhygromyxa sp. WMMC2535]NVB36535.1 hypothetical protein [Pseudenhygromyxa sp. WMMC2535]